MKCVVAFLTLALFSLCSAQKYDNYDGSGITCVLNCDCTFNTVEEDPICFDSNGEGFFFFLFNSNPSMDPDFGPERFLFEDFGADGRVLDIHGMVFSPGNAFATGAQFSNCNDNEYAYWYWLLYSDGADKIQSFRIQLIDLAESFGSFPAADSLGGGSAPLGGPIGTVSSPINMQWNFGSLFPPCNCDPQATRKVATYSDYLYVCHLRPPADAEFAIDGTGLANSDDIILGPTGAFPTPSPSPSSSPSVSPSPSSSPSFSPSPSSSPSFSPSPSSSPSSSPSPSNFPSPSPSPVDTDFCADFQVVGYVGDGFHGGAANFRRSESGYYGGHGEQFGESGYYGGHGEQFAGGYSEAGIEGGFGGHESGFESGFGGHGGHGESGFESGRGGFGGESGFESGRGGFGGESGFESGRGGFGGESGFESGRGGFGGESGRGGEESGRPGESGPPGPEGICHNDRGVAQFMLQFQNRVGLNRDELSALDIVMNQSITNQLANGEVDALPSRSVRSGESGYYGGHGGYGGYGESGYYGGHGESGYYGGHGEEIDDESSGEGADGENAEHGGHHGGYGHGGHGHGGLDDGHGPGYSYDALEAHLDGNSVGLHSASGYYGDASYGYGGIGGIGGLSGPGGVGDVDGLGYGYGGIGFYDGFGDPCVQLIAHVKFCICYNNILYNNPLQYTLGRSLHDKMARACGIESDFNQR